MDDKPIYTRLRPEASHRWLTVAKGYVVMEGLLVNSAVTLPFPAKETMYLANAAQRRVRGRSSTNSEHKRPMNGNEVVERVASSESEP